MIIGLTGGIASGKSHLAEIFEKHSCAVFDADRSAKACLINDTVIAYLDRAGFSPPIDKKALAQHLFNNHKFRAGIERIVHPMVQSEMLNFIGVNKDFRDVVLDIPLLFEKGLQDFCDLIIFVYSPYNTRVERAAKRGWSLEDFIAREQCQFPVNQKERMSDIVLPSYDDLVDLDGAVRDILKRVKK